MPPGRKWAISRLLKMTSRCVLSRESPSTYPHGTPRALLEAILTSL